MNIQTIDLNHPLWLKTLQKLPHDFYHLPEYVYLESQRTHTIAKAILISEGENLFFLPYLLRRCDDIYGEATNSEVFDVISPYGYPGILLSHGTANTPKFLELAMNNLISTLHSQNICSAFFRLHPILNAGLENIYTADICQLTGETIAVDLTLSPEEIWKQTRSDHRKDINRQKRSGFQVRMVKLEEYFDEFIDCYLQTMARVGAAKLYFFSKQHFENIAHKLGDYLHLGIVECAGEIMSACIFTECCGIVQSYLSGTKNQFLKLSPDKLLFDYVRFWAKERGNQVLHLGGGYGSNKDGVYQFKAGFSHKRYNFLTLRLITDRDRYDYLVASKAKYLNIHPQEIIRSKFFPVYRSPLEHQTQTPKLISTR
ncbi:MAG: GNAT family N-acetyltransferase [Nostocaceae cyanobacterium]|nr:GNAT family N-acetyltransferase [Nostocaceae cyanobacterium]